MNETLAQIRPLLIKWTVLYLILLLSWVLFFVKPESYHNQNKAKETRSSNVSGWPIVADISEKPGQVKKYTWPLKSKKFPKRFAGVSKINTEGNTWDKLAACESSSNWNINSGNGYYGGLQFKLSSWHMVGGSGYPHHASKVEQIERAELLKARQGWKAWPQCSKKIGIR